MGQVYRPKCSLVGGMQTASAVEQPASGLHLPKTATAAAAMASARMQRDHKLTKLPRYPPERAGTLTKMGRHRRCHCVGPHEERVPCRTVARPRLELRILLLLVAAADGRAECETKGRT